MAARPESGSQTAAPGVDTYLAALPARTRAALEELRASIRAVVPDATEVISYQIPTFKLGRPLVAYAGFKDHCSLFVMSTAIMGSLATELTGFDVADTKTTIRFTPDRPLPARLVARIVKARIAENEAHEGARRKPAR
jgi:uncharacterized protein YdhG (YjbR/CyaY superfamily)